MARKTLLLPGYPHISEAHGDHRQCYIRCFGGNSENQYQVLLPFSSKIDSGSSGLTAKGVSDEITYKSTLAKTQFNDLWSLLCLTL
ncbi:hypothetical protein AAY473_039782 [Plecturocebus cupreus]